MQSIKQKAKEKYFQKTISLKLSTWQSHAFMIAVPPQQRCGRGLHALQALYEERKKVERCTTRTPYEPCTMITSFSGSGSSNTTSLALAWEATRLLHSPTPYRKAPPNLLAISLQEWNRASLENLSRQDDWSHVCSSQSQVRIKDKRHKIRFYVQPKCTH